MVGAVGVGMLGDSRAGFLILIAHSLGALLTGLLLNPGSLVNRPRKKPGTKGDFRQRQRREGTETTRGQSLSPQGIQAAKEPGGTAADRLTELISKAIFRSLGTLGLIGGFLVIFSILSAYTTGILCFAAEVCRLPQDLTDALCAALPGLLEMTVGCSSAWQIPFLDLSQQTVWCSFLISFGGLSVMGQTAGVLQGTGLSMKQYMGAKLLHGLTAALIAEILVSAAAV